MDLSHVIIGPVQTEKSERLKQDKTYVLRVQPMSTKIDLKNALRTFYDVDVKTVRVLRTTPKSRLASQGSAMEKRHRTKRMLVRLTKESKPLDTASLRISA